MYQKKK